MSNRFNNKQGYTDSKINDEILVKYFNSRGRQAKIFSKNDDIKYHIDIALEFKDKKIYNVDTKYVNSKATRIWYEFTKHDEKSNSKADYLLYCLRSTNYSQCFLIKRDALNRITNDGRKIYTEGYNSPLKFFNINELNSSDFYILNLSKLNLK